MHVIVHILQIFICSRVYMLVCVCVRVSTREIVRACVQFFCVCMNLLVHMHASIPASVVTNVQAFKSTWVQMRVSVSAYKY